MNEIKETDEQWWRRWDHSILEMQRPALRTHDLTMVFFLQIIPDPKDKVKYFHKTYDDKEELWDCVVQICWSNKLPSCLGEKSHWCLVVFRGTKTNNCSTFSLHSRSASHINDCSFDIFYSVSRKSNLYCTRGVTPKRVTSGGIHLRDLAPDAQHSAEETWHWCDWRGISNSLLCPTWPSQEPNLPQQ